MIKDKVLGFMVLIGCLGVQQSGFASFTDVTSTAGLTSTGVSAGAAWGDYDKDGCVDLAVNGNDGIMLYHSACDGTFSDVTASAGIAVLTGGRGIVWADYDNDGDLDLYGASNLEANVLYQNNGDGTFTNVAAAAGVDDLRETAGVSWGDYDVDGHLDLFLANRTGTDSIDRLYHNNGDGTFTDVAPSLGIDGGSSRLTWMGSWVDFDNNGTLDLYLAVDFGDDVLYKNNGNGTFTDVAPTATNAEPQHGMGTAIGDLQGDGHLDILVTNNTQGAVGDVEHRRSVLHINNGDGTFRIASLPAGIEDRATIDWGVNFVDYDNDGDNDISITSGAILSSGEPNVLYENNNGLLTNVTDAMGVRDDASAAWSSVWADYDMDGDLDWFVVNQKGSNVLFRNDGDNGNHIKIALNGTVSNASGVGARVEITVAGITQVKFIQAGLSFASAEELSAFFGVADSTTIDEVTVLWPSGIVDQVSNVAANQMITITEGSGEAILGSLSGVITDSLGVPVDRARIRITNVDTGDSTRFITGSDGQYLFEDFAPGLYSVQIQKPNLGSVTTEAVIEAGQTTILNLQFDGAPTADNIIKVTEVSALAGIANEHYFGETGHSLGVSWIDYDNDGWDDLFVPNGFGFPAHLYHNNGDGTFSLADDLLPSANYGEILEMSGARFGDYDNDGDNDIFISVDNENFELHDPNLSDGPTNILLKNKWVENGNQILAGQPLFEDVSAQAGIQDLASPPLGTYLAKRTKTMGLLDYDQDGCLDVFWGQMVLQAAGGIENRNTLYRNNCDGTGTFTNVTDSAGVAPDSTYYRPSLAFQGVHLDSDNHPDMYVCNVHEESPFHHDVIYQNNGDGTFTDITGLSPGVGDDSGSCMGVDVADIDLNGTWDLYASDVFATQNDASRGNPLYLGNGDGTFQENSAVAAGVDADFSWGVNFVDLDLDGYEDLFVAGKLTSATFLYNNNQDGTFADVTASSGLAGLSIGELRGAATSDYDHDGDMDIVVVRHNGQLFLLRNDTETNRRWLKLNLVGVQSNKNAIGAIVKLTTKRGLTMMRQIKGGVSSHSQSSLDVHFGTKRAGVEQIEIQWPSGIVDVLTQSDVSLNTRVTIVEGSHPAL